MTENKLICPFCQQELSYADTIDGGFEMLTCDCKQGIWFFGNDKLWQELINEYTEHDLTHDALVKRTQELDRTRKALDLAVGALDYILKNCKTMIEAEGVCRGAFTQINIITKGGK